MNSEVQPDAGNRVSTVTRSAAIFLVRALTPLHPGSGASVSGLADLPVQREAHTGLPVIYGSSVKGALRSWAPKKGLSQVEVRRIFGPEMGKGGESAGMALFTDARLLFLAVKSLEGVFAWVTCPFIVNRFFRDIEFAQRLTGGQANSTYPRVAWGHDGKALIAEDSAITVDLRGTKYVILEDVALQADPNLPRALDRAFEGISPYGEIKQRLAIVSDDTFRHLLSRGLSITPHIAINEETGTVSTLWFQEDIPPETIFYFSVFGDHQVLDRLLQKLPGPAHMGGDMTTGLGFVELLKFKVIGRREGSEG